VTRPDWQDLPLLAGMLPAVAASAEPLLLERPGLRLRHWRGWLAASAGLDPSALQAALLAEVPWKQEQISLWGRIHPLPRLTCWVADPGCTYRYSGLEQRIEPWTPGLEQLRQRLHGAIGCRFNALLLNLYRDGSDRMGWHADDEPELDPAAPIASLSLGAGRCFQWRPRPGTENGSEAPFSLELAHGDLLVMDPPTQRYWQHQLPARRRVRQARINLTFRLVRPG